MSSFPTMRFAVYIKTVTSNFRSVSDMPIFLKSNVVCRTDRTEDEQIATTDSLKKLGGSSDFEY
jgi:hypothetical protein